MKNYTSVSEYEQVLTYLFFYIKEKYDIRQALYRGETND